MKKLLFAALIFTSCTKQDNAKMGGNFNPPPNCMGKFFFGGYKAITKPKYALLDSAFYVRSGEQMRLEMLQQTKANDTPIYYYAERTCDSNWHFYSKWLGISHYVRFDKDTLIDSLVIGGTNYDVNKYRKYRY